MHRLAVFIALCVTGVCLWSRVAHASDAKTALIRDAVVSGNSIYLADLLPGSSPSFIRARSQEILIGKSPQPGSSRTFSSEDITRVLNGGSILSQVEVPERIVVHRFGHVITREEVAEAIRKTANRNNTFRNLQIAPESIRLSARVSIAAEESELRVTRIELDRTLHEMKFWLVSGAEPTLMPFIAMVDVACDMCASNEGAYSATAHISATYRIGLQTPNFDQNLPKSDLSTHAEPPPPLVDAGDSVRLRLFSHGGMQMFLAATSLERGSLGQHIRVKIQTTGKILSAHIVGQRQLEVEF